VGAWRRLALPRIALFALFALTLSALTAGTAAAQLLLLPEDTGPRIFPVSQIELEYAEPHSDQPPLEGILPVEVVLTATEEGYAAPHTGDTTETVSIGGPASAPVFLEASGLALALRQIVAGIHEIGLYGVDVRPAARDIDLESERDLRPEGRDALAVVVTVGRIEQIRTIALGDRIKGDWKIDHELHDKIRKRSPLQPVGNADGEATDLLNRRQLEDYLFQLNRHSGRKVEAALSPSETPGGVVLDYRVLESKPWYLYSQVSNTGTDRTNPWQVRVGAVHRQLTNRDDVFSIEYLNSGLDDVNGVRLQYQAPFFGAERPEWMNHRKGDADWLTWVPRDRTPWWGIDRLRWEVDFAWGRFEAGRSKTIGSNANDVVVSEQLQGGGRLIYETWQYRDFFVDLWGGIRLRNVDVDNKTGAGRGEQLFVLPGAGVHAERINALSTFGLDVGVSGTVNSVDDDSLEKLGRSETDKRWATINFNLGYSTYLEPIFNPKAWRDPATHASSTLAHEVAVGLRGQYAFDYRLIPQASQILGGLYSVRGYDQSVAVGDTVVISSFEYRFHLPRSLPVMREPMQLPLLGDFRATPQQVYGRPDWDLVFRAFLDVGRAIRNKDGVNLTDRPAEPDQTLVGAGIGAELVFRSNLRARVDWGFALTDTSSKLANPSDVGDQELHVLFSILY
jgi:hypothetical protein